MADQAKINAHQGTAPSLAINGVLIHASPVPKTRVGEAAGKQSGESKIAKGRRSSGRTGEALRRVSTFLLDKKEATPAGATSAQKRTNDGTLFQTVESDFRAEMPLKTAPDELVGLDG